MKRAFAIAGLVLLGLFLLSPLSVLAIADPDTLQIIATYVYEDCLETGDRGVLIYYLIDYTVLPTDTATEAYLAIFLDTDGTTQLAASAPYTFVDSGYGYGVIWIYFSADDATAHGLDVANRALYRIRISGNPTVPSGWPGDPPAVSTTIDYWQESGDTSVLVALQVLYYADQLEILWSIDMIESTALGNRLTVLGEDYFTNVIPSLRTMAPAAFSSGTMDPIDSDLDFSASFGAVLTNATGTAVGSPITLVSGENTVNVTATGTFTVELNQGTLGTVTNSTAIVTGSPVSLVAGTNIITATTTGLIIVDVALSTTQTSLEDTIIGTGFDLTDLGLHFGMTRMWMSSIIWFIVTLIVCAAVYKKAHEQTPVGAGKVTFLIFDFMFIGGIVLAMVPMVVGVLLFLACNAFIGYILFFRAANV